MEAGILMALTYAGYLFANNHDNIRPPLKVRPLPKEEAPIDIYNRTSVTGLNKQWQDIADKHYDLAKDPENTNVIPTNYNFSISYGRLKKKDDTADKVKKLYKEINAPPSDITSPTFFYDKEVNFWNGIKDKNNTLIDQYGHAETFQNVGSSETRQNNMDGLARERSIRGNVDGNLVPNGNTVNSKKNKDYGKYKEQTHRLDTSNGNKHVTINNKDKTYQDDYSRQFEEQTFDNQDGAVGSNAVYKGKDVTRLDLERKIALKEGWSPVSNESDMTYDVVTKNKLTHNNMVPYFSGKHLYGDYGKGADDVKDIKLELFSGSSTGYSLKNPKQEVAPFFSPVLGMTYPYGSPNMVTFEKERYVDALNYQQLHQGELLMYPERVSPGLNFDYDQNIVPYKQIEIPFRDIPKTVDELRAANKPKISYAGVVVPGLKVGLGPVQADVIKQHKPAFFKWYTDKDLLPVSPEYQAQTPQGNWQVPETFRQTQHMQYYGPMQGENQGVIVPDDLFPKVKEPFKQVYEQPGLTGVGTVDSGASYAGNWVARENERSTTTDNEYIGPAGTSTIHNVQPTDIARPTVNQTLVDKYRATEGNTGNDSSGSSVYAAYQDIAKPTINQSLIDKFRATQGNTGNDSAGSSVYAPYQDIAKPTLNQTLTYKLRATQGNAAYEYNTSLYVPYQDMAKNTINQTLIDKLRATQGNTGNDSAGSSVYAPYQDIAKPTMNQTLIDKLRSTQGNVINEVNSSLYVPYQDTAKPTLNQTLIDKLRSTQGNVINEVNSSIYVPYQDSAKPTMNQTLIDKLRSTQGNVINEVNSSLYVPYQDLAKPTMNQTLIDKLRATQGNVINDVNSSLYVPYQDSAKPTMNQTLIDKLRATQGNVINDVNSSLYVPYQDTAKATINQSLIDKLRANQGNMNNESGSAVYSPFEDVAKPTLNQTLIDKLRANQGNMNNESGSAVYSPLEDIAKPTINQSLIDKLRANQGNMNNESGSAAYSPFEDVAKPTLNQTLIDKLRANQGNMNNESGSAAYSPFEDVARPTTNQTLLDKLRVNQGNMNNESGSAVYSPYEDVAKNTINQTLIDKLRATQGSIGTTTITNSTGYMSNEYDAKPTNRESTSVYWMPAAQDYVAKQRSRGDVNSMEIDDRRQIVSEGRLPTPTQFMPGAGVGPTTDVMYNVRLKNPERQIFTNHVMAPNVHINTPLNMADLLEKKQDNRIVHDGSGGNFKMFQEGEKNDMRMQQDGALYEAYGKKKNVWNDNDRIDSCILYQLLGNPYMLYINPIPPQVMSRPSNYKFTDVK